jgi:hypothetical protein
VTAPGSQWTNWQVGVALLAFAAALYAASIVIILVRN